MNFRALLPPACVRLRAGTFILASAMLMTMAAAQTPSALIITSPVAGASVTSGQSLAITVTVGSGAFPNGVGVIGQIPIDAVYVQSPVVSTAAFTLPIPATTSPGFYSLSAMGTDATGAVVFSTPVSVDVERPDHPTALAADPAVLSLRFTGDTLPLTVWGTFTGGTQLDVTQSTQLTLTSENPLVATAQNGIITAVAAGLTNIDVQYGSITVKIAVTVPLSIRGDLNRDGQVDKSDLNVITDALNTPANGSNDARDLNHDGVINALDARILVTLCTHPGCATQ